MAAFAAISPAFFLDDPFYPQLVLIASAMSEGCEAVLGRAMVAMAAHDPEFWGVVGHGSGAAVATLLAKTMAVRTRLQCTTINIYRHILQYCAWYVLLLRSITHHFAEFQA